MRPEERGERGEEEDTALTAARAAGYRFSDGRDAAAAAAAAAVFFSSISAMYVYRVRLRRRMEAGLGRQSANAAQFRDEG